MNSKIEELEICRKEVELEIQKREVYNNQNKDKRETKYLYDELAYIKDLILHITGGKKGG